ncbi:acyl-CoA dehydrogenase family protein [Nocardiopsis sp. RSe5-2]|uniref:Acyl-CoA dehydrogenase family protein n=1 Tax=Nocardiopsis endophytica TaxID=3018445 RepID=A0ABT4U057_9ACTN|nr:acyl-CoA dehydrogenase family protein [Nocardiopsis endophytica]MDA2810333.1 acyl-CoA dehydrogenase family protein [Nocardiopsis endophytica]
MSEVHAGEAPSTEVRRWWRNTTSLNTQIYEGTNQIQRMVMARQLLK